MGLAKPWIDFFFVLRMIKIKRCKKNQKKN
jgi:hypothetical protein